MMFGKASEPTFLTDELETPHNSPPEAQEISFPVQRDCKWCFQIASLS